VSNAQRFDVLQFSPQITIILLHEPFEDDILQLRVLLLIEPFIVKPSDAPEHTNTTGGFLFGDGWGDFWRDRIRVFGNEFVSFFLQYYSNLPS
jgi:hypothetical protein